VGVLFSSWLSAYTQAWQFYLGAFFILIVMTTPGGLASLIDRAWHLRYGDIDAKRALRLGCGWQGHWCAGRAHPGHRNGLSGQPGQPGRNRRRCAPLLWGWRIDVHAPFPWVIAVLCMAAEQRCSWLGIATGGRDDCAGSLDPAGVYKAFDRSQILRGVDLQLQPGERCALIGANGAGKSSLFHVISGRYRADAGRVLLHGRDITHAPPQQIHRLGLARSFQITSLFPRLSAFENVRCALLWTLGYRYAFWRRIGRLRDASERALSVLEKVGLAARAQVVAGELSYAEQRALELAVTIAADASVILLDEPTAGMSRAESGHGGADPRGHRRQDPADGGA
jgi:ABC-type branched-subunit amino acid transport system ATPase component